MPQRLNDAPAGCVHQQDIIRNKQVVLLLATWPSGYGAGFRLVFVICSYLFERARVRIPQLSILMFEIFCFCFCRLCRETALESIKQGVD